MDTLKAEKATAMRHYHCLRFLTRFLRLLEACAALVAFSWCSAGLPVVGRSSCELLHAAAAFLLSPSFVFLIGNAIVLVLFSKFRQRAADGDLYSADFLVPSLSPAKSTAPEAVFEDKEVCGEPEARGLQSVLAVGDDGGGEERGGEGVSAGGADERGGVPTHCIGDHCRAVEFSGRGVYGDSFLCGTGLTRGPLLNY